MGSRDWFDVSTIAPGVTMIAEPGHVEHVHSYVIEGADRAAVLDTGMGVGDFRRLIDEMTGLPCVVIQSHAHWDHIGASSEFQEVLIHRSESDVLQAGFPNAGLREWFQPEHLTGRPLPDEFDLTVSSIPGVEPSGYLDHGDTVDLGDRTLQILHTPGHSPGGLSVIDAASGILFPADAINYGPIYLESDEANLRAYVRTLELLANVAHDVDLVYPSHYDVPLRPGDILEAYRLLNEVIESGSPDTLTADSEIYHRNRFEFVIAPGALEGLRNTKNG